MMGTILLTCGRSQVYVNKLGGKFHWNYGEREVMPLIDVPMSSNQRSSHTCFPIFGLPKELIPPATKLMARHGPFRTSDLTVLEHNETSIGMELANRPGSKDENIFAQYPYYFIVQQYLELLNENTLHFSAVQHNIGEVDCESTLALHSYFDYDKEGVTLVDLQGRPYGSFKDGINGIKLSDDVLADPLISGPLAYRDWKFPPADPKSPLRLLYPDGRQITLQVADSRPAVNNWVVWMDPTQCTEQNAFICVEPLIRGLKIKAGRSARLDVIIRYQPPPLSA